MNASGKNEDMSCGEVKQIRLGEMLKFKWDSSGALVESPLSLSDTIDLGGSNTVAVNITACDVVIEAGVSADFNFQTAPINGDAFFADKKDGGSTVSITVDSNTTTSLFQTAEGFSRFFALAVPETLTGSPTIASSMMLTIDVVVRA